jgi:hypothetical protein
MFRLIRTILRFIYRKPHFIEFDNLQVNPALIISNHLLSYGPVQFFLFSPFTVIPWVIHDITRRYEARDYIRREFVLKELHLHGYTGYFLAWIISVICLWIMRRIGAIPVFSHTRSLLLTFEKTIKALEQGKNVIIFIEQRPDQAYGRDIGFLNVAEHYHKKTGRTLPVYFVKTDGKSIRIIARYENIVQHRNAAADAVRLLREMNTPGTDAN